MIWRRILVRSDSSIADLHLIVQVAFGWSDLHLHQFIIRGKRYGLSKIGGVFFSSDARKVRLSDFRFRVNERFRYEYDFGDLWEHQLRVEQKLPLDADRTYPVVVGGQRAAPPEDCGGPDNFLARCDAVPSETREEITHLVEAVEAHDINAIRESLERLGPLQQWLTLDKFDRRAVNRCLRQLAEGSQERIMDPKKGPRS
jgi:Plasmid pRiA4b ORF-3-like protein